MDYIVSTTYKLDDQISAGANAATEALKKLSDAADKVASSTAVVNQTTQRSGPSYDSVNRKIDETAALTAKLDTINRKYTQGMAAVRAEADAGGISADQLAEKEARLATVRDSSVQTATKQAAAMAAQFGAQTTATNKVTEASGNAAFAQRQFGVQSVQLFSSIATGQPILTAFIQQGHQMVDVALSTGTGFGVMGNAIKSALGFIISPLGLALTATVALGAAIVTVVGHSNEMQSEQRLLQTAIDGVGRSAGTSSTQLQAYAVQLAHTSELSKDAATAAIAQAIRTPGITQSDIAGITALAPNLGTALGTGTTQAVKDLTDAYTGNWAAIQKLLSASNDFSLAQVTQVRQFLEQGNKASALKIITEQLSTSMKDAQKNSMSPMAQAFKDMANGWDDFLTRVANYPTVVSALEAVNRAAQNAATLLRNSSQADIAGQVTAAQQAIVEAQRVIDEFVKRGITIPPELTNTIAQKKAEIDALYAKSAALLSPQTLPKVITTPSKPELYGPVEDKTNTQQNITIDKYNKALDDQNKILSTAVPLRAAVAAGLKADNDNLTDQLPALEQATRKQKEIATAQRAAGDAAVQEAAAQDRATKYAVDMTKAIQISAVAALQMAAADEASEKAATQAGVSVSAYTKILLNRNAAQAVQAGAQQTVDLQNQLTLSTNIANATDAEARHQAELNNAVISTTKAMVDKAAASQNPGMIAAAQAEVDKQKALGLQLDANNTKIQVKQTLEGNANSIAVIDAELSTLTATDAERNRAIALIQEMNREKASGLTYSDEELQALKDSTVALADKQTRLQHYTTDANEIGNAVDQIGNNIGQSLSNAFISGQGAAVNFGSVMKSVMASILQEVLKLAVINPILNEVVGGTYRATLGGVTGGLFGSSTSSSGSTSSSPTFTLNSAGQLVSTGSAVSNAYNNASGLTSLSSLTSLTSGGFAPLWSGASSAGATGFGAGFLNTSVIGGSSMGPTLSASEAASMGLSGNAASMAGTAPQMGGLTYGGIAQGLGGIAAGFGLGSMAGGLIAGNRVSGQQNSQIGAGVGALAGAALGPLGSVVGGLLGGTIGSLFGPGNKNMYSSQGISLDANGNFVNGRNLSQVDPNAAAEEAQVKQDIASINAFMNANGIKATSLGGITQLGDNTNWADPSKAANLDAGFSNYRFTATNASSDPQANIALNTLLNGKSFGSSADLTAAMAQFQTVQAQFTAFITNTNTLMTTFGKTTGSVYDSIKSINDQMDATIASMETTKNAGDLSANQVDQLTAAEAQLNTVRAQAIQTVNDQAAQTVIQTDKGLTSRYLNATAATPAETQVAQLFAFDTNAANEKTQFKASLVALFGDTYTTTQGFADQMAVEEKTLGAERLAIQKAANAQIVANDNARIAIDVSLQSRYLAAAASISGSTQDAQTAQLYNFDQSLQPQRDAFTAQLVAIYGDAYTSTTDYASEMLAEERTFGEERLAIIQSYNDKATQTASATIVSISSYLSKLQTSSNSPLSPLAQLALAESQFSTLALKAQSGDFTALGQISGSADSLLSASRAVNGSGAAYVADFNKVLDALSGLTTATPDSLTASVFTVQTQSQTQILSDALAAVKAEIVALRLQMQQINNTPAQVTRAA